MRRHAVIVAAALAWLITIESAEARLDILVDKASQRMMVTQNGYMRYIWPVSTGRDETATPSGVYAPQRLERNWFSTTYYNSPMPYSIFFHNGYAIHGSYAIDRLGGPASHGCVRLHPHHAALLFDLVQQEGPGKTTIEITEEARSDQPSLPGREIAAGRGPYPPVPRIVRYRETGDTPELPPAQRGDGPMAAGREIAAARGLYPPAPRIIRYRETGDMPELSPAQRGNGPMAAKSALPPRPPPPQAPAGRRMLTDVRPPAANLPRAPSGATDTANGSPRPSDESSDSRPKPRLAEAPPPEPAQHAPSSSGFKLLPASCWTGGASRWRWWASGQGTPCR
ncbi:L,D-transpeptidase family protein [Bradyrhizobium sp.]|uniref:L,D-transpeptidase n=1 Tax=Bradyrhizobium sp. TaxID=376 RepID=UPI003C70D1C0